jgi:hypothetical protein|tara:strand:+ start:2974 stop:3198 length:225 start_codon:yes stop_codon:yes gene_type:complete
MRAMITKGGLYTWINVRENKFIEEKFDGVELLEQTNLSEREQYIAQTLVGRGVLDKTINGKDVAYKLNINNFAR